MKVVLLLAGEGKRLKSFFSSPKSLLPLQNQETILSRLVIQFKKHLSSSDLLFVVGYKKEEILSSFPEIPYVENFAFTKQNTAKSLLLALDQLEDDLIWINGDVVCQDRVIDQVFLEKSNLIVGNITECTEEEVKYKMDEEGKVMNLGKTIVGGIGESLGIQRICKKDLGIFRSCLEQCKETDFFEKAMEIAIQKEIEFKRLLIGKNEAIEVDFPNDYEKAKQLVKKWSQ